MKSNVDLARELILGKHVSMLSELQNQIAQLKDKEDANSYLEFLIIQLKNREFYDPILEQAFEDNYFLDIDIKKRGLTKGLEFDEANGTFIERRDNELPIILRWIENKLNPTNKAKQLPTKEKYQTLKLKEIPKSEVEKFFDGLVQENYIKYSRQQKSAFKQIFFHKKTFLPLENRIFWIASVHLLKHFINSFKKNGIFENLKYHGHWKIVINTFKKADGEPFEEKDFKGLGTPLKKHEKDSISKHILQLKTVQAKQIS